MTLEFPRLALVTTLFLALAVPASSAAPSYSITNLGEANFLEINAFGQIVGSGVAAAPGDGGNSYALLWTPISANSTTGSTLSLDLLPEERSSRFWGINASGQIIGESTVSGNISAVLWTPTAPNATTGSATNLLQVKSGMGGAGINAAGQVVGNSTVGEFFTRRQAWVWTPDTVNGVTGTITQLGDLPGGEDSSAGTAINSFGQVVGGSSAASGGGAFLWTPPTPNGTSGSMINLGVLPGGFESAGAADINDTGQVVGTSRSSGGALANHAFLWTPTTPNGTTGTMLDLGALSGVNGHSEATAVNGLGHVVGSHNASIGQQAFLWTPQDGILDLNSLLDESGADWRLFAATDINDFGQIIGYGTHDPDGPGELFPENVAFLLTPLPEPTMLLILGAFGPLLVRRYRPQSTASAAVNGRGRRSNLPVSGPLMVVLLTIPLPLRAAPFTLIATHPDAAAQPTASGQILATLKPFNGKLYAGFGNYTSDDGPIGIRAFDPVTGQFTNQLLRTLRPPLPPIDGALSEAIFIYREIGGKLYAPHIDPPGTAADPQGDFSGYAVGIANGSAEAWTDFRVVPRGHMFDMATFDGNDLWVVGAVANNISLGATDGVAWRSRDGGVTWQESLRVPPQNTAVPVARLYSIHAYKGKLYTQGQNISPFMPHSTSKVFDGTSWSDGPSLGAGTTGNIWHPETFAGYMVYHRNHSGVDPDGSRLFKFDGTVASFAYTSERFYDYTIGGDALYALLTDGRIIKTTDLLSWSALDVAPADGRSLGILDNNLYLGATGGHLYRYSLAVPEPGSILALAAGLLFLRRKPRLDQPWAQRLQHELN